MRKGITSYVKLATALLLLLASSCIARKHPGISGPEKCWAMSHPFVYKKAYRMSRTALFITDSIGKSGLLDRDAAGGQLDAFRHACWMALTCRAIGYHRALSLGRAHEKGNYKAFLKGKSEDGASADKTASDMDLWNNRVGARIGKQYRGKDTKALLEVVLYAVKDGRCRVIKKDRAGQPLDAAGNRISTGGQKKWVTERILVPSDFVRP